MISLSRNNSFETLMSLFLSVEKDKGYIMLVRYVVGKVSCPMLSRAEQPGDKMVN